MLNRFYNHYKNISSYDLFLKFNHKNSQCIPNLNKIVINFGSPKLALEKKKIIPLLMVLKLISGQKGKPTLSKKNKIHLKIKKGMIVGCKVTLNTKKSYDFLENLIIFVFPNIKEFNGYNFNKKQISVLSFKIHNILHFPELQNEFLLFSKLPPLNITIHIKSSINTINESDVFLNSFNFPIKNKLNI